MQESEEIKIINEGKKSFKSNRFIVGLQFENGKRLRWPLHSMRQWELTPASGEGFLKSHQSLSILIGSHSVIVEGKNLEHIDQVFCEGSGGEIIEQGTRYLEITQAKPFVAKIEVRDNSSLSEF